MYQTWDISCRSSRCIAGNKYLTLDRCTTNHETIGNPRSYTLCLYTQQDSVSIDGASCLSLIEFWLVVNYIIFRTSHFFSSSSSSPFHYSNPWLQEQFNLLLLEPKWAEPQGFHAMRLTVIHSINADTSQSTTNLHSERPKILPRMHDSRCYVKPEAARIWLSMRSDWVHPHQYRRWSTDHITCGWVS